MIELNATKKYILELEKQNNNLKEDFKRHVDRINELTNRIDKAKEYIGHYNLEGVMLNCQYWYDCLIDLLDILKGSDKE